MKVKDLKNIPHTWEVDEDEKIEFSGDLKKEDPWVKLYAGWREFMSGLTHQERQVVKRWTCGDDKKCSNKEINDVVKATKGTLNKD